MATILLIEDDADLAYALSQSFTLAGHRVITALDGMSALDTLDTDVGIDLLLTDLIMPAGQPHGLALANMARQRRPDLAVILMTGHPELRDEVNGYKILLKPVRAATILDEIAASLSTA
jgi:DNA-binding NtrC family response regulator